jgi:transcriptional regulator with XRE-family HTH domain
MAKADLRRVERCRQELDKSREDFLESIVRARESGETLRDIAVAAGISHQRVAQIVRGHRHP